MIVEFYPLDVGYETNVDGKGAILLFGRTTTGQKICVFDTTYEPYFYVFAKHRDAMKHLKESIEALKIEQDHHISFVTKVEITKMRYMDKDVEVLKVYVPVQKDLDAIREEVRVLRDVGDVREGDLPIQKRYLVDKDIVPLALYKVEGEAFERSMHVDLCIMAESISLVDSEFLEKPKILAFDIEVYCQDKHFPIAEKDPVLMIALYSNYGFQKVLTWKKFSSELPVEFLEDESALLRRFEEILEQENPDYLVGYFSDGFDIPYLAARAKQNHLKMHLGDGFKVARRGEVSVGKIKGIIHLDIFKFIKQIMGGSLKLESYSLRNVVENLLEEKKYDIAIEEIGVVWDEQPEMLEQFCSYNLQDAKLALLLCEKVLPNMNELVRVTGQPLFEICRSSYSQLVEFYFMKRAREFKEIYPNKPNNQEVAWRRMHTYEGAFVYEPKPGLYEHLVVLDYRSLYPSLIVAKNITPSMLSEERKETYETPFIEEDGKKIKYFFSSKEEGFIPLIVKDLILRRNRIKELIKKEEKKNFVLEARSYSLKIIANATYGYFGFFGARWYSRECASSITAFGRQYIQDVIQKSEESGFQVVYSDTDSVMVVLGEKTKEDIFRFLKEVNEQLPSLMEVELEDFYSRGIFVTKKGEDKGAKKKYALISEKGDMKVVGFETIRRDWSFIAKEVQKKVLEMVLRGSKIEQALEYIQEVLTEVKNEQIPKEKMIIQTQLKKKISGYDLVGPHVMVAKRMRELGEDVGPGSVIKYIVTKGKGLVRDKARIPEEAEDYDPDYYIRNQVLPAVEKIFEVLGHNLKELESDKTQNRLQKFWNHG